MELTFDFWDNYQNMLKVILWKQTFIPPNWDNVGVPLGMLCVTLSASKIWALVSSVDNETCINNIKVDYTTRGTSLNKNAMKKLVEAYFEAYDKHLRDAVQL
tara:strand:+ start:767 stop:1072 length:306 start_codon:yes stop_codon:yes gene_type:complete